MFPLQKYFYQFQLQYNASLHQLQWDMYISQKKKWSMCMRGQGLRDSGQVMNECWGGFTLWAWQLLQFVIKYSMSLSITGYHINSRASDFITIPGWFSWSLFKKSCLSAAGKNTLFWNNIHPLLKSHMWNQSHKTRQISIIYFVRTYMFNIFHQQIHIRIRRC